MVLLQAEPNFRALGVITSSVNPLRLGVCLLASTHFSLRMETHQQAARRGAAFGILNHRCC